MSRAGAGAVLALLSAAAVGLASCDLGTGPSTGVFAISSLKLPSPGMVVGDTMRDSTGAVAALRVIAFNAAGETLSVTPSFVLLEDTLGHLASGSILVGDKVGNLRILGSVGALQTLPETVKVTLSPDSLGPADSVRQVRNYSFVNHDTLPTSLELATRVLHGSGTAATMVDGVIVRYTIVSAPPANGTTPTVTLMNGSQISTRDTTQTGRAARTVRLRVSALTVLGRDSAIVDATAAHKGVTIGTVRFVVVFQNQ